MSKAATGSTSRQGVLLGLGLAYFGAYQLFKLPVVLPVLLDEFGYDRLLAGGFMSAYAIAGLLLSVWIGAKLSRDGPFGLVSAALLIMIAANLIVLCAPGSGLLMLACRSLEGVSFAVLAIAGPVLANQSASQRLLPLVFGLTAMWIPTGQMSATLVAVAGTDAFGWQLLWYIGAAGCVGFLLWCRAYASRLTRTGNQSGSAQASPATLNAAQKHSLVLSAIVFLLWSGQYFAYMTWLPQYVIETFDASLGIALLSYLIPVAMLMVFTNVTGLMLRAGAPVGWLLSVAMLSQVVIWAVLPWTEGVLLGATSLVVYGIGAGIVPTCLFAMPTTIVGAGTSTASAFGIIMTGRNLGVLAGPIALAQLFNMVGAWSLAGPVFGVWTAVALVVSVLLARRLHAR